MLNHWWQVTLYVTPRGLTTSSMPVGNRTFEIEFDFCAHQLRIDQSTAASTARSRWSPRPWRPSTPSSWRRSRRWAWTSRSGPCRWRSSTAIPFAAGHRARQLRPRGGAAVLAPAGAGRPRDDRVPRPLRRQGQPGALLLGRHGHGRDPLLRPPRAAPSRRRAELRRLGDGRGLLPRAGQLRLLARRRRGGRVLRLRLPASPTATARAPVAPAGAFYSTDFRQFLLPYEAVRTAPDPDAAVLEFLQTTYEAAADWAAGTAPRSSTCRWRAPAPRADVQRRSVTSRVLVAPALATDRIARVRRLLRRLRCAAHDREREPCRDPRGEVDARAAEHPAFGAQGHGAAAAAGGPLALQGHGRRGRPAVERDRRAGGEEHAGGAERHTRRDAGRGHGGGADGRCGVGTGAAGTASAATSPAPAAHAASDVIRLPSAPTTSANESVTHPSPSEARSTAAPRCTNSRVRITAQCDGLDIQPVIAARAVVISGLVTGNVCEAECSVSLTFQSGSSASRGSPRPPRAHATCAPNGAGAGATWSTNPRAAMSTRCRCPASSSAGCCTTGGEPADQALVVDQAQQPGAHLRVVHTGAVRRVGVRAGSSVRRFRRKRAAGDHRQEPHQDPPQRRAH